MSVWTLFLEKGRLPNDRSNSEGGRSGLRKSKTNEESRLES